MGTKHFVIMGVSGSGKTTVALALRRYLGGDIPYAEGDDFHPDINREKMRSGIPLDDHDRYPWLIRLCQWMNKCVNEQLPYTLVTCSALKKSYRDILRQADGEVYFIHLYPPVVVNRERLTARQGHFMKVNMLDSQLATLEPLYSNEMGITIDHDGSVQEVMSDILRWLQDKINP